jgi:GntR family transcriptional regulator/MocR family aminotransferase
MFTLNNDAAAPLYRQLYQQIRERVLSGKLPAHTRLPSVRELAAELSTSRNTVEGAYQELYAEGYIYSKERSGYFVCALDHDLALRKAPGKPPGAGRPSLAFAPRESWRYDFHPAGLDPSSFPTALWRNCFLKALAESSRELTAYGGLQGDWGLRCQLRQYLERSRGVICEPEQIVVCAGLQQGLEMVAQLVKDDHRSLAVEEPGYHIPRSVFANHAFRVLPVAVGPAGMDLEQLRRTDCSVAYVTPSHQLPLGCVMPVAERLKLIDWAQSDGKLILEDDYDGELRYHGKPIPSLQGLRPDGNIVYLGTFSKILSPALRMSYLVLPRSLLAAFQAHFRDYFCTVSLLEQKTMAQFMERGHWERHVRRMRVLYHRKHDALLKAVGRFFGGKAAVIGQGAGLHVVLELSAPNAGEAEILRRATEKGIRLFPFSATCAASLPASTRLLVGFGGMGTAELERGIELLSALCLPEG